MRRRGASHIVGSCVLVLTTACGGRTAEAPPARWVADATPTTDIPGSGPSGEVWLERPVAAARLASGEIAVADAGAKSVLFFDTHGQLLRRAGREGGGPGEYRNLLWLGQCQRDSLFAWDPARSRIVVLDTAGTVVRHFAVPMVWAVACNRTGRVVLVGQPNPGSTATVNGTPYASVGVSLLAPTGAGLDTIMHMPLFDARFIPQPPPLGAVATVALTAERIYVGTPDTNSVSVYTSAGQLEGTVLVHTSRRPATERHFEAAIEAIVDAAPPDWRTSLRQQIHGMVQKPEWLPFYGSLFADSLERVWAQTSFPGDSATVLGAVGDAGAAEIVVSRPLTVFEVGTNYVLGTYAAPDGTPHVALYTFRPQGPRGQDGV